MIAEATKRCMKCGETKALSEFRVDRKLRGGLRSDCKSCGRAYYLARIRCPVLGPVVRQLKEESRLRCTYGLSKSQIEEMRDSQGAWCANVGCPNRAECVDHCHSTGKVRGLLCNQCNTALGMLGDDVNRILLLASYLRDHKIAESP